jgi:uncharacterized protein YybS (DUF2232 family)
VHAVQQHHVPKNVISGIVITFLLILGAVTAWLVPLPVLYYRIKLGRQLGMIIPAVMIVILVWLSKSITTELIIISGWMLLGFLISECFESGFPIEKTILYSSSAVLVSGVLALFFYSNMSQVGIYDLAFQQVKVFLGYLIEAGLIAETPDEVQRMVTWMLPGIITTMVIFIAWVNVILAIPLLRRNQLPAPEFGMLDLWKAPEKLVWVAIFGTVGMLVETKPVFLLSMNVMCLVLMTYFLQGISIVSFFVKKTRIPPALRYLLYWLVFFQFPVNLMVTGIGLFDMWVDFRKRLLNITKNDSDE